MTDIELALFFLIVMLYSVIAYRLDRLSITMPLVLVLASALIGPHALGLIDLPATAAAIESLTEITLALLLFADASTLDFSKVRDDARLVGRLLLIGLPLTVLFGGLAAYVLFPEQKIGFALLLGAILAPTDAALGMPIFSNPRVPVRIRRALNVESGLNDGIVTPLVTLFLALTIAEEGTAQGGWFPAALIQIGIAVGVGAIVGLIGGRLFAAAVRKNWTAHTAERVGNLALGLATYFGAISLGGNGFIAAFVGGIVFGYATRSQLHEATEFTENNGTLLSVFVWAVFGANLVIPLLLNFDLRAFVFALLSLTVVRMVPVAIALLGTHMRMDTVLMMGWLGPRGLASVVFMLIASEGLHENGVNATTLVTMASWTILLSVVLHGLSAAPLANWYAHRMEHARPDTPELLEVVELPARRHRSLSHSNLTK
jgi:NhaP-type Na+/H+ or K+/H+ antiporter